MNNYERLYTAMGRAGFYAAADTLHHRISYYSDAEVEKRIKLFNNRHN